MVFKGTQWFSNLSRRQNPPEESTSRLNPECRAPLQLLIPPAWEGARECVFLTSSQGLLLVGVPTLQTSEAHR